MFIKENELVEINVYCKKIKTRYIAITESEYKQLNDEDKKKYELLTVKMQELTWGLFNQLQDSAMVSNSEGDSKFNYRIYKENRLKKLIKEWNAKDSNGKSIPVNDNMISHLAPSIAETILKSYDEITYIGEEEEGK